MMCWGFATLRTRGEGAMTKVMFMNILAVLRGMLDALVGSWMRQTVARVEQARTRIPCDP
jgi:hypothetical protein